MARKKVIEEPLDEVAPDNYVIRYTGTAASTTVTGLGSFPKGKPVEIDEEKVEHAKQLVKTSRNFEEVKA